MKRILTDRIGKASRKGKLDAELKLAAIADDLAAGKLPDDELCGYLVRAVDMMLNSDEHSADALLAGLELNRPPGGEVQDRSIAVRYYWLLRAAGKKASIAKDEVANHYGVKTARAVEQWVKAYPEEKQSGIEWYEDITGKKAKTG